MIETKKHVGCSKKEESQRSLRPSLWSQAKRQKLTRTKREKTPRVKIAGQQDKSVPIGRQRKTVYGVRQSILEGKERDEKDDARPKQENQQPPTVGIVYVGVVGMVRVFGHTKGIPTFRARRAMSGSTGKP